MTKHLAIYQNKNGVIELKTDLDADTIWTIETLKKHTTDGDTINPNRVEQNYQAFMSAVEEVELLVKNNIDSDDVVERIKSFANTWFSLASFDENKLPQIKLTN